MAQGEGAGRADAVQQGPDGGVGVGLDAYGQQVHEAADEVLCPGPVPAGGEGAQGQGVAFGVRGEDGVHAGQAEHVRADAVPPGGLRLPGALPGADPQAYPVAGSAEDGRPGAVGDEVERRRPAVQCALPELRCGGEVFGARRQGPAQVVGVGRAQGRQGFVRVRVQGGELGEEEIQGPVVGDGVVDGEVDQGAVVAEAEHQGAQEPCALRLRAGRHVLGDQGPGAAVAVFGGGGGEVDVAQGGAGVGGEALLPAVGCTPDDGPQGGLPLPQPAQRGAQPREVQRSPDQVAASDDVASCVSGGLLFEPDPLLAGRQRQPRGVPGRGCLLLGGAGCGGVRGAGGGGRRAGRQSPDRRGPEEVGDGEGDAVVAFQPGQDRHGGQ